MATPRLCFALRARAPRTGEPHCLESAIRPGRCVWCGGVMPADEREPEPLPRGELAALPEVVRWWKGIAEREQCAGDGVLAPEQSPDLLAQACSVIERLLSIIDAELPACPQCGGQSQRAQHVPGYSCRACGALWRRAKG